MNPDGHSLIELLLALSIAGILAGLAAPPLGHARDVLAVRAARAEIVSLAAVARSTAILTGGATLVIDVSAGSAWVEAPAGVRIGDVQHPGSRHGVSLTAQSPRLSLRYDGLGIGRMTNAVLRVRSGRVTGTLTVSAYGRVRQS
ncbi:MAG TPA: type II secretion system protein [Longimicrobiales bacterium]